jgi:mannobiose 2-epimerase
VAGEALELASQASSAGPPPSSTRPLARPLLHWIPRGGLPPWEVTSDQGDFEIQDTKSPLCTPLYAQGFAIYSLSTYALTFDRAPAARRALDLFLALERHRHDDEFGGYDQTSDGGWMQFVTAPEGAAKCTNTHIHLLEALTPLCRALPEDDLVASRLLELASFISETMLQPSGYVHKFFARDGTPVGPAEVSYGHDLETSWLLVDALDALQFADRLDAATRSTVEGAATKMARHALRTGWDPAGGVFDSGIPEGQTQPPRVTCREKIWWAQAETLPGLFRLYQRTHDPDLVRLMDETLDFLATKSFDAEGGEFFWGVDSDGNCLGRGDHKGEMWKTPYHALRACLITADWIRQELEAVSR